MSSFNRSAEVGDFKGRTLEGTAYKYDYPSRVTDDGWQSSYYEEMLSGSDTYDPAWLSTLLGKNHLVGCPSLIHWQTWPPLMM